MSKPSILVIGSINVDLVSNTPRVPAGGETITGTSFSIGNGGKGANQAVACAKLSRKSTDIHSCDAIQVKMIGCVGDDDFGKRLKKGLLDNGVDVEGVEELDNTSSGVAVILVEPSGENRIIITPGANGRYLASPDHLVPAPSLLVLQLETPLKEVQKLIEMAALANPRVPVVFNPAPAVPLPSEIWQGVDHLIVNETEAALLSGMEVKPSEQESLKTVSTAFRNRGVRKSIIITLGSQGAFWLSCEEQKHGLVPAIKVKVVDTTAAGDTFLGAFSVQIVSGASIENAVAWAIKASSRTVTVAGAQDSIPWADQV